MTANLIFILRRRWPLLVGIPLFVTLAVITLAPSAKPPPQQYRSIVYIAGDSGETSIVAMEQMAVDIRQSEVAGRAMEITGDTEANPATYAKDLKAKVNDQALTLRLTGTRPDEDEVAQYTRAFAEAYLELDQERLDADYLKNLEVLETARDTAESDLRLYLFQNAEALADPTNNAASVQRQLLTERLTRAETAVLEARDDRATTPFRIAGQEATTEVAPSKLTLPESRAVRAVLAFLMAVLGTIALVAILEKVNPRVDTPKEAEDIVGAPVVAMVPVMKGRRKKVLERADLGEFSGPFAESFRAMRSHLDFRSSAEGFERPPCVMIVSSAPNEGKTTSTAFLALSYAEVGRDVVVIGADFRRPAVHRLFGVARTPGLSSRLLEDDVRTSPEELVRSIVKRDEKTGVRVIPSGPGTDRVTGLLDDLSAVTAAGLDSGCTVVIDTVPVMVANDAIDFLPLVDWVVVVVRLGRTTVRSLRQTITSLELNAARIVGCVMIGSLESSDSKRYYYSYYRLDDADQRAQAERQTAEAEARAAAARSGNGSSNGSANGTSNGTSDGSAEVPAVDDEVLPAGEPITIEELPPRG